MTAPTREQIEAVLAQIQDPHTGQDLITSRSVREVALEGGDVRITISLGYPARGWFDELAGTVRARVSAADGVTGVQVDVQSQISAHVVQKGTKPHENIRNILAVASGKGGVGKSTVSANLALALAAEGARVGVLDADIYGPSQPRMLGVRQRPETRDGRSMEPVVSYGLQTMSIGFLIDEETPMIWRGPMVTQALEQLLRDTNWDNLDYLVIDLPPGTGDIQLTLSQKVPVSGALIVTTPQDIALLDARKAYRMFEKVEIPVLGVIENMSTHICSHCGHEEAIFGSGGGQRMAEQYGVSYLGALPLDIRIREDADGGRPTVIADPDGPIAASYRAIARHAAGRLATHKKDFSGRIPTIRVQAT